MLAALWGLAGIAVATAQYDPKTTLLLGRWEVVAYSEQGVQVDKKAPALPQAVAVYRHVQQERATYWYGYSPYEDLNRREVKAFREWIERDSAVEVDRIRRAIELPYFAVFFADSTLSIYNKDIATNQVSFPEVRHFTFWPNFMSLDITPGVGPGYAVKTDAQVLLLTETRMTLFLPETAEIVELIKTAYTLP